MNPLRATALPLLLLVACGGDAPPIEAPAPPSHPPAAPPTAAPAASTALASAPDAHPTERTAPQHARDEARAPLANAIMDAYTNFGPLLSRDGKKVLFGSSRDGNRQYYLSDVAAPGALPVAITHGPERAGTAAFSRDGKSVIFTRDTGADENYRIYQVGLDGKNETCLTPGPVLHRYPPLEARGRPGTLVYARRDVKTPAIEVVVQKIGGEPKVVFTQPGPGYVIDITNDGKRGSCEPPGLVQRLRPPGPRSREREDAPPLPRRGQQGDCSRRGVRAGRQDRLRRGGRRRGWGDALRGRRRDRFGRTAVPAVRPANRVRRQGASSRRVAIASRSRSTPGTTTRRASWTRGR